MIALPIRTVISLKTFATNLPQRQISQSPARSVIHRRAAYTRLKTRSADDDVEPVPPMVFQDVPHQELLTEAQWLSGMIRLWLNEEWTHLDCHKTIGDAAGDAYLKLRKQGLNEAGDIVLGLASELLSTSVNFKESFVNAFEVSNKSVELLMFRSGCEVCCTSGRDRTAIARYELELLAEQKQEQQR